MSYLHTPRLVFSGDFLSDVSTVNNDPAHYNNETFKKSFQEFGQGGTNGWWNPEGGAVFDFQDCTVQKLVNLDGSIDNSSELIGELIKGADGRATGKMVDLDPQQQGVSQLWSVRLRVLTKSGDLLLEGLIEPTAFRDLQYRQTGGIGTNGQPLGGTWTSVLTNLTWGEKASQFDFFSTLKATTQGNKLSVNLNGFGYYYNHADNGRFSLGKILGAIGPWFEGEPDTFAPHRRLYGVVNQSTKPNGFQVYFSTTNFLLNTAQKRLSIDFGASFPIQDSLGTVNFNQNLILGVSLQSLSNGISTSTVSIDADSFIPIETLNYGQNQWLLETGGIIEINDLKDAIVEHLKQHQLILVTEKSDGSYSLVARESIDGYNFRADNFVQRVDNGQTNHVNFFASQWGNPISTAGIKMTLQPATAITPKGPDNPISEIPGNNYPADRLTFDQTFDISNGAGVMTLTGNKIKTPRGYLDGQIYFIDYALQIEEGGTTKTIEIDSADGPMSNDSISVHLRSAFDIPEKPTWSDIEETMIQFSNLYPIMSKYLVDLGDPEALKAKSHILEFAFSRPIEDPMYMPVTRDLSENKRLTILKWLADPIVTETSDKLLATDTKASKEVALATSPAKIGQELTEKQLKLKRAMQAKSGQSVGREEFNQLKF